MARRTDYTVAVALAHPPGERPRMVAMDRFTGLRYSDQIGRVEQFLDWLQPLRVLAETNNMGSPLVERLQEDGYPVEGFTTTASTKPDLIRQFQPVVNQREIDLLNDPVFIEEVEDFEEEDKGQHVVFSAPERKHDDCVIAGSLAWRAYAGEPGGERAGHFTGSRTGYQTPGRIAPGFGPGQQHSWARRLREMRLAA